MHSCVQVAVAEHLRRKSPQAVAIVQKLLAETEAFGAVTVSPVKNGLMLKSASTFLAVKPRKEWVDIEFLLDEEIEVLPIHKTFRVSKRRVAHFVRLEDPREISRKLVGWLKRAFELTSG
jgi:hypothetical protein